MVPAGNKAKRLPLVNHTTKRFHHHHHYHHHRQYLKQINIFIEIVICVTVDCKSDTSKGGPILL